MSYGHADKIARNGHQPGEQAPPVDQPPETTKAATSGDDRTSPVPPEWYARPELQPVLTGHDFATLFRALGAMGISQRQIARLTGRSQPNISEIVHGRQVISYDVLVAITKGLSIPPERMGLSWWGPDGRWYGPEGAYGGGVTVTDTLEGVSTAMLRRHLIAFGGLIMAGLPIDQVGELKVGQLLDDVGELPPVSLPSRLSTADVAWVRDTTCRLGVGNTSFADPGIAAVAAELATRLLDVPGPDPLRRALIVAVAELRIEAGRAACFAGLYRNALYHHAQALELATDARDAYCQATALHYAGFASTADGHPDDGLKMMQAAQVAAWGIPSDDPRTVVVAASGKAATEANVLADSAVALMLLGQHDEATRAVAKGRDLWTPTTADPFGDLDRPAAQVELHRGRVDVAHALATASLQRWDGGRQLSRTRTGVVLATVHVRAGEPRGLQLAHRSISEVAQLPSVLLRKELTPLAQALETRPGTDARDLARMARQVAA
ncbi:MAG: helix-turn-helix domain-containing protein [Pseudonocardiales bacterium]